MPIAAAVPAIISAAGSIGSAVIGSRAAKGAAKTQSDAAAGVAQNLTETGERAATDVTQAGERAATDVANASEGAASGVQATADEIAAGFRLSADEANGLLRSIYGDAVTALEPYKGAGTTGLGQLAEGMNKGGEFNREFTAADMEALDPGYAFRLEQGQRALERSAAVRGGLQSGGTLKELTRYSQGVASDEFGRAFDRFRANRSDRFNMLNTLAGIGQRATEAGINTGETYGSRASGNIMDASRWGGDVRYRGVADAGQFRVAGANNANEFRLSSLLNAGRFRTGAASDAGRILLGGADARAAGQMGAANAWAPVIPAAVNLGKTLWGMRPEPKPKEVQV
jgi:hypothetical protein